MAIPTFKAERIEKKHKGDFKEGYLSYNPPYTIDDGTVGERLSKQNSIL